MEGLRGDALRAVYDRNAAAYDARRPRALFEDAWLRRFARTLPAGARVLDLGCGTGRPIADWLTDRGFAVTGLDFSSGMLERARAHRPGGDWRHGDMRTLDLEERFDGVLSWDAFFHLGQDEQREALPRIARHVAPGGMLMLTVGPDAGEATGKVEGEPVYHASLSPAEYATLLERNGLRLTGFLAEDPDCDGHSVLLARKGADRA